MTSQPLNILMLEDSENDIIFAERGFRKSTLPNCVRFARTGIEGLELLGRPDAVLPDVILVDLDMPKMGGKDFIASLKADDRFNRIPVFVITSSMAQSDIADVFAMQANGYFVKPVLIDDVYQSYFRDVAVSMRKVQ